MAATTSKELKQLRKARQKLESDVVPEWINGVPLTGPAKVDIDVLNSCFYHEAPNEKRSGYGFLVQILSEQEENDRNIRVESTFSDDLMPLNVIESGKSKTGTPTDPNFPTSHFTFVLTKGTQHCLV